MRAIGYCQQCGRKHPIDFDPACPQAHRLFADWKLKHSGHAGVGFDYPQRSAKSWWRHLLRRAWDIRAVRWLGRVCLSPFRRVAWRPRLLLPAALAGMLANADVKIAYAASASPTITLASLAASSTLLAGRESTAVDNGASVKYLDYHVGGNYRAAASNNQAGSIHTCVVGANNDTPTWPDVFDGTDSTETVTDSGVFDSVVNVIHSIGADNTASQDWPFGPVSVAYGFGGMIPDQFVYFVTQNIQTSTNAWNASGNTFSHTPLYATVT